MIDIDEYIEMWEHDLLGSNGVADLMDSLILDRYQSPVRRALKAEVKRLRKRNDWLEEVVAQAQEHYHIDLSDEGWPRWEEEE